MSKVETSDDKSVRIGIRSALAELVGYVSPKGDRTVLSRIIIAFSFIAIARAATLIIRIIRVAARAMAIKLNAMMMRLKTVRSPLGETYPTSSANAERMPIRTDLSSEVSTLDIIPFKQLRSFPHNRNAQFR